MADKSATIEGGMPVAAPEPEKDIELEEKTRPVSSNSDSGDSNNKKPSSNSKKEEKTKSRTPWYNPLRWNPPPPPKERAISREFKANVLSQFIFWWANDLLYVGYKRPLELQDLPRLAPERHNKPISERLDKEFRRRVAKGDKHPLLFALNTTFFNEFWFGGACQLLAIVLMTLSPLILKYIIQYSSDAYYGDHSNSGRGIGLAVGVIAMQLTGALAINQWAYRSLIVGGMARGSLISLIYAKSQVISARAKAGGSGMKKSDEEVEVDEKGKKSKKAKKDEEAKGGDEEEGWSNGRVSNLMSTDTSRINQAVEWSQLMVTTPIQIIIALIQLVINLGAAALPGFGLLMICGPGMYFITRSLAKRRGKTNKITDARISLTQELLSSIRFVKYFAWEKYFLDKLEVLRKKEIYQVQVLLGARSAITAVAMTLPVWAAILSFLTYSLTHDDFNPADIFASLALFNTLRIPLNLLPMVIGQSIDAYVSLGRIEQYLQAEDDTSKRAVNEELPEAFLFDDASFTWETVGGSSESDVEKSDDKSAQGVNDARAADAKAALDSQAPFQLEHLNLSISRKELIAVVGAVGCGKTSLLAAIAGEMRQTTGEVQQGSNIAYCSQYAWIQNATVKDNITFGQPFVKEWYDKVVDACALKPDFKMFTAGDLTEVGERGITLSGGQKQRISIARAIYFNASIIVMDDPLSAVDASVGKKMMDEAICGVLAGKCRILATHQLHVLDRVDRIIYMADGKIDAIGTYDELRSTNKGFMDMLAATSSHDEKEKEDEEEEEAIETTKPKMSRANTKASVHEKEALMQEEERQTNSIKWTVYKEYFQASGTIWNVPMLAILVSLAQASQLLGTLWLSWWSEQRYRLPIGGYIGIYAAIGFCQSVFLCSYSILLTVKGTNASKVLLRNAMQRVLRAPMWFFDTTPLGRIINRFSADVNTMDNFLTEAIRMYALTVVTILSIFILIVVYYPYYIAAVIPALGLVYFMSDYFRTSNRELKRHEAVLRSGVFSVFGEAVAGTSVIKAYGVQDHYRERLEQNIDEMNSAYFLTFSAQCWLSLRLDVIGNTLALITCLLIVTDVINITPALAGVLLTYVLQVVGMIQFAIRQLAEMENAMNSTERVQYYANELPSEITTSTEFLTKPPPNWPETGNISFSDVTMRYRPGLPLVLKGLTVDIKGGERVGIVGRTGAGKSSIMSCLFRLVELDGGYINIDGVDIATLSLTDLRSRLSIIPQDPTLFKGTVRSNLDPLNEHTDLELWNALRQANLVETESATTASSATSSEDKLETTTKTSGVGVDDPVVAEGLNFSLGQRQLLAFARARLRGSRIIVCDEATSSVDLETDAKVQKTMQEAFKGRTLLVIAHRLRTIINYERVLVLDQGRIAEVEVPYKLWKQKNSAFREICDKSNITEADFTYRG